MANVQPTRSVTFYSLKYKDYKIVMEPTAHALVTEQETGKQKTVTIPARIIKFDGFEYTTSDEQEIEFLKNANACTGANGAAIDYRVQSEEELIQREYAELINEFGQENVTNILKRMKAKKQEKAEVEAPAKSRPARKKAGG